jgi:hypothetical protein
MNRSHAVLSVFLASFMPLTAAPAESGDVARFETECGAAVVPPLAFGDVLCLGTCTDGEARVNCRHSESRGDWCDEPLTRINAIAIKITGMIEVEDLARQLEGHTGWDVVVDSVDESWLIEGGEWRAAWPELSGLALRHDGPGKIRIVADENARRLVIGSALLTPADYEREVHELESAAKEGNLDAAFDLGVMYFRGEGVPQSDKKAVEWWRRAAKRGNPIAQTALAGMFQRGRGVKRNFTKAAEWYREAIARDYGGAWPSFCSFIETENVRTVDIERFNCLIAAALRGSPEAQYEMGLQYSDTEHSFRTWGSNWSPGREHRRVGDYVRRLRTNRYIDLVQAYVWLGFAAEQGHEGAATRQENLCRRMRPEEIAEAEAKIEAGELPGLGIHPGAQKPPRYSPFEEID